MNLPQERMLRRLLLSTLNTAATSLRTIQFTPSLSQHLERVRELHDLIVNLIIDIEPTYYQENS